MTVNINGYEGWTSVSVSRSVDDMAGTFELSVCMDRPQSQYMSTPALSEDQPCTITVFGQTVITGFIDKRVGTCGPEDYTLTLSGRSKTRNCIDCSSIHDTGQYNNQTSSAIVQDLAGKLGVTVLNQLSEDPVHPRFIFRDGEYAERTIRTCCREFGITATDDEQGNLVLKEIGKRGGGSPLILGQNIHSYTVSKDVSERYSEYIAKGQSVPTDDNYGKQASDIVRKIQDSGVNTYRPLILHMDGDSDNKKVDKRGKMEATRRTGEGIEVSIVAPSWQQEGGAIWQPDTLHYIDIPLEGVAETMLLKAVNFRLSNDAYETDLTFVPPQTYTAAASSGKTPKGKTKTPSKQLSGVTGSASNISGGTIASIGLNGGG